MQNRAAIIAGGVAAAAAVAYGLVRRKPALPPPAATPDETEGPDPRAEALREKLAVSRELAAERDAFEEGETPVDEAFAAESDEDVEERRRAVHERGRAAADAMRRGTDTGS